MPVQKGHKNPTCSSMLMLKCCKEITVTWENTHVCSVAECWLLKDHSVEKSEEPRRSLLLLSLNCCHSVVTLTKMAATSIMVGFYSKHSTPSCPYPSCHDLLVIARMLRAPLPLHQRPGGRGGKSGCTLCVVRPSHLVFALHHCATFPRPGPAWVRKGI